MSAVYRTLYEKYEQNDVLHVGIQEVVEAEKEIDTFLKSLDRNQRDQLDTLLGRLSRAYEMQGFLFGGLASGAKWNGKTAPEPGDGYGRSVRAYHGSTLAPVCQIDRKTNQVIHEYPSIAAVSWLLERGFEVKLEKQYTSKDVYTVAKDGVSDEFTFPSGQKNMNVRTFMERYGENFEKKKELIKLRAEAARAVPGFKK